jgi:hypothetical protein
VTTPVQRLARLSTLVLALVACSFTPGGALLCLGFDGHVAVELAAGRCAPASGAQAGGEQALSGDDCCGPCLDVTLDTPVPTRVAGVPGAAPSFDLLILPARVVTGRHVASPGQFRPGEEVAPRAPGAARHSILRC